MFDLLRKTDQNRVGHIGIGILGHRFLRFLDQACHGFTLFGFRGLARLLEGACHTLDVQFGLFQMRGKGL
jgi:hypothetical protein